MSEAGNRVGWAGLVAVAVLAAVSAALLPPLLLGIRALWFVTVPFGVLLAGAVVFRKPSLVLVLGSLFVLALGVVSVQRPMRLSSAQSQKLTAMGYFLRGQLFFLRGNDSLDDYSQALDAYRQSEQAGLDHPWVSFQRAYCYNFLGRPGTAFEIFARLMHEPRVVSPAAIQVNYALSAAKAGYFEEGEQAFHDALERNFYPGYCYYQLGILYRTRGDQIQAAKMMTNAHRLGQDRSDCSSILGSIAEARGLYDSAEVFYRRAVRENVENITAYVKLGSMLFRRGRAAESKQVLLEGADIASWALVNPRPVAMLYNNLGFVYAEEDSLAKAIASFEHAILKDPTFMDSYDNLAHLFLRNDRRSSAIRILQMALAVNPGYSNARRMLEGLLAPPQPDSARRQPHGLESR